MALDATITTLEEQNEILEDIRLSAARLKSIDTRLMNQHLQEKQKRLRDKEESDERKKLLTDLADSIRKGGMGSGGGADAASGGTRGSGNGLVERRKFSGVLGRLGELLGGTLLLGGILSIRRFGRNMFRLFSAKSPFQLVLRKFNRTFGPKLRALRTRATQLFKSLRGFMKPLSKFLGRMGTVFGRIFGVFVALTSVLDAHKTFMETEGSFTEKLGASLKTLGISIIDALVGWVPNLTGWILSHFGAPDWMTDYLKNFSLREELTTFVDSLTLMFEDSLRWWMSGQVLKDLGNLVMDIFESTGRWVTQEVYEPLMAMIRENKFLSGAMSGAKMALNVIRSIPTLLENFVIQFLNGTKVVLRTIIRGIDKIKIPSLDLGLLGETPEVNLGSKVIPKALRDFAESDLQKTKKVDLFRGVPSENQAGIPRESKKVSQQPVVVNNVTNNNTVSSPVSHTNIAAETEAAEKFPRRRRAAFGGGVPMMRLGY